MRQAAQSEVAGSNSESKESKKRGRPKGSKDKGTRKHKLTHANVLWALSVPFPPRASLLFVGHSARMLPKVSLPNDAP